VTFGRNAWKAEMSLDSRDLVARAVERRAVEAAIWGMPLVNVDAMRQAYFRSGAQYNDVIFWSNPNTRPATSCSL
jgi:hypothetical protein